MWIFLLNFGLSLFGFLNAIRIWTALKMLLKYLYSARWIKPTLKEMIKK